MQANGAAGMSAAGTRVATQASGSGMLPSGGATPAEPATPAVAVATPAELAGLGTDVIALELTAPTIEELAGAHALAGRSSMPLAVKDVTPSVSEVIGSLDTPVLDASQAYIAKRDRLHEQLRAGHGDPKEVARYLDDLDALIRSLQRSEEKQRLMKELIRKLMLGLLTPELIGKAKAMGLIEFVQQAIKQLIKGGMISPSEAKAMSLMLAVAGIQVPELDAFVHFHERRQLLQEQRAVDAARAGRDLQPSVLGLAGTAGTGTGGTGGAGSATEGAQTLGLSPDPLVG